MGDSDPGDVNDCIDKLMRCAEELRWRRTNPERLIGKRTSIDDLMKATSLEIPRIKWTNLKSSVSNHDPKAMCLLLFYLDVLELCSADVGVGAEDLDLSGFLEFIVSTQVVTNSSCPNFLAVRIFHAFLSPSLGEYASSRVSELVTLFTSVTHTDDSLESYNAMSYFLTGRISSKHCYAMLIGIGHRLCLLILSSGGVSSSLLLPVLQTIFDYETFLSNSSVHAVPLLAVDDEILFPFLIDRLLLTRELFQRDCLSLHSRFTTRSADDFTVLLQQVLHWDASALVELLSSDCDALSYLLLLTKVLSVHEVRCAVHRSGAKKADCAERTPAPASKDTILVLEFDRLCDGEVTKTSALGFRPNLRPLRQQHSDDALPDGSLDAEEHRDIHDFIDELKDLLVRWGQRGLLSFSPTALVNSLDNWQHKKSERQAHTLS